MTERLYYDDAYRFAFDARVLSSRQGPKGWETVIDRTCFYPGGGGQPADRGTLAGRTVLSIEERGDDIVHVLDGEPVGVEVHGELDAARRLDFMAQHTGEHLLSQCLLAAGNLATVSVHFSDDTTTIEVAAEAPPDSVLADAERRANAIVRENRKVRTRELDREEALKLPLRRRPPEGERLRIVEIEGCDWAACGGVHVASTGAIVLVKIAGVERIRGRSRIHALMGERAFADYGRKLALSQALCRLLTCGEHDILKRVGDLAESERGLVRELRQVRAAQAGQAAAEAVAEGRPFAAGPDGGARRFVSRVFDGFGEEPVKAFVDAVLSEPGRVVVAVDRSTNSMRWTVAHSLGAGDADLAALVKPVIAALGLRGGGRQGLVQGAGSDPAAAKPFVEAVARAFSA
ncbi:MAG: alanyl-tRNA editing protein [Spirochaetes bacterium]|nr:alanyl-tRNA editing protein [Spirochaetota bacterium]